MKGEKAEYGLDTKLGYASSLPRGVVSHQPSRGRRRKHTRFIRGSVRLSIRRQHFVIRKSYLFQGSYNAPPEKKTFCIILHNYVASGVEDAQFGRVTKHDATLITCVFILSTG